MLFLRAEAALTISSLPHHVPPCASPSSPASLLQTVELSDCERTQALALRVLLSLSKFNQHRIHEMDCYHGYSMIHQVLIKPKSIVGYHVLKVSDACNTQTLICTVKHVSLFFFSPSLVWRTHISCIELSRAACGLETGGAWCFLGLRLSLQSLTNCAQWCSALKNHCLAVGNLNFNRDLIFLWRANSSTPRPNSLWLLHIFTCWELTDL